MRVPKIRPVDAQTSPSSPRYRRRQHDVAKMLNLTRADVCSMCGLDLDAGVQAYWFAEVRVVKCVSCAERAAAGGSALREYERRAAAKRVADQKRINTDAAWRERVVRERPVVGRIMAALRSKPVIEPESQAVRAWLVGAEGERRVADVLAACPDLVVLNDRKVPGTKGNIDHLCVGPAGVFVIDAKKYDAAVRVRGDTLFVGDRDRTHLVESMGWQVDAVRRALGDEFSFVDVSPVLCFVGSHWQRSAKPYRVRGVTVLWPDALPDVVGSSGQHRIWVDDIGGRLRSQLRSHV